MLNLDQIKRLAAQEASPCVSIYLPAHRKGPETRQDPVRLKNLLGAAEERLLGQGMRRAEIEELLRDARALVDDFDFWQHQCEGLAVFVSPGHTLPLRLPATFPEEVHVGVRFHVKHLLPLVANNGRFYLLAFDQDDVRLYGGSRHGMQRLETEHLPESIARIRGMTDYQEKVGFHPTGPTLTTTGTPTAKRHAGGESPQDVRESELKEWLREVAAGVGKELAGETAPLVVAADERSLGHFRGFCSYASLLEEGIAEHPDSFTEPQLHERAWALVEPLFRRRLEAARDHFAALAGEGHERAPREIPAIVDAARQGRVDVLFVAEDAAAPGRVDPDGGATRLDPHDEAAEDLLDRAAVEALATGATVYAVPQDEVPGGGMAAGVLRY